LDSVAGEMGVRDITRAAGDCVGSTDATANSARMSLPGALDGADDWTDRSVLLGVRKLVSEADQVSTGLMLGVSALDTGCKGEAAGPALAADCALVEGSGLAQPAGLLARCVISAAGVVGSMVT